MSLQPSVGEPDIQRLFASFDIVIGRRRQGLHEPGLSAGKPITFHSDAISKFEFLLNPEGLGHAGGHDRCRVDCYGKEADEGLKVIEMALARTW